MPPVQLEDLVGIHTMSNSLLRLDGGVQGTFHKLALSAAKKTASKKAKSLNVNTKLDGEWENSQELHRRGKMFRPNQVQKAAHKHLSLAVKASICQPCWPHWNNPVILRSGEDSGLDPMAACGRDRTRWSPCTSRYNSCRRGGTPGQPPGKD